MPAGTYTGMQVTLSQSLTLYPTGSTTGTTASFASTYNGNAGQSKLSFAFQSAQVISGTANLYIDFELGQWQLSGSTVSNAVVAGGAGPADSAGQIGDLYQGTVTSLSGSAPTYTFTIATAGGQSIAVTTSASTGIYDSDGSSPTLAQNQSVSVRGSFSVDANALAATSVRIDVARPRRREFWERPATSM